jgi:hypothetical protein
MFTMSEFKNTTPHGANNVQHNSGILGVVVFLFVGK